MAVEAKRSTVYLEPELYQAVRIKSAHTNRTISDIVNESLRDSFREDQEDLEAFEQRANEPVMSYEALLAKLKKPMAKYEIVFKRSVYKDLKPIPKSDVVRILKRIDTLADDPRGPGCEKLSGQERYRIRQGVYRIVYEIVDKRLVITVVKVGHRGQVYDR